MRRLLLVIMILAAAACGGDNARTAVADERYSNDVDGVAVAHPSTWHRAESPLAAHPGGDLVEVLALATGELPEAEQACSPYPWAAMKAMRPGDVILTVRAAADAAGRDTLEGEPLVSKPEDLLAQAPMAPDELPGGCAVDEVEPREVDFLAHGRRYRAFVASKGLEDARRDELRTVWSSLTLRPIATGDGPVAVGTPYWHLLSTHCGIAQTGFGGRDWVADPVLDDGNRNPPPGWGNPTEPGTMTLVGDDRAEFRSRDGASTAAFRPRVPADPPAASCE